MKIIPHDAFTKAIFIVGIMWAIICIIGIIAAILNPERLIIY